MVLYTKTLATKTPLQAVCTTMQPKYNYPSLLINTFGFLITLYKNLNINTDENIFIDLFPECCNCGYKSVQILSQ